VLKLEDVIKEKAKENQMSTLKQNTVHQKSDKRGSDTKVNTNNELAKLAGVSHNTIHQFRTVKNEGAPEIQKKVREGDMSINKAYRIVRGKEDIKKESPAKEPDNQTISLPISLKHIELLVNNFLAIAENFSRMTDYIPQLGINERKAIINEVHQIVDWHDEFIKLLE
jgi:hypothetical protein